MRRVVSNTGPLLHLHEAQLLPVLQRAGELYIPPAVEVEMVWHERDWRTHKPGWIMVAPVGAPHATQAARWEHVGLLDSGEAEAIALAQELNCIEPSRAIIAVDFRTCAR